MITQGSGWRKRHRNKQIVRSVCCFFSQRCKKLFSGNFNAYSLKYLLKAYYYGTTVLYSILLPCGQQINWFNIIILFQSKLWLYVFHYFAIVYKLFLKKKNRFPIQNQTVRVILITKQKQTYLIFSYIGPLVHLCFTRRPTSRRTVFVRDWFTVDNFKVNIPQQNTTDSWNSEVARTLSNLKIHWHYAVCILAAVSKCVQDVHFVV